MPKIKKFPKTISVKISNADDNDDYLDANVGTDMIGHAEMGQKIKVAIYELKEVREVEGVVSHRNITSSANC